MLRYVSGEVVAIGDTVITGNGNQGIIEKLLYPGTEEAKAFACPEGGVLVQEDWNGDKGYLSIEIPPDRVDEEWADVKFVRRAGA